VGALEGVLVNPACLCEARVEEEDIEVVFEKQVNEKLKGKTLAQLECAKASADNVSKYVGECIQELEKKVLFEEPLTDQFKRIFRVEMPSSRLSLEQYYEVVVPVLKRMERKDVDFFYLHYGEVIPDRYKYKYYF